MKILLPTLKKVLEDLRKRYAKNDSQEVFVLKQLAKLNEETGEVAEAILAELGAQRSSKDKEYDVGSELADVIVVAVLLGLTLDIDMYKKIVDKLETIKARASK